MDSFVHAKHVEAFYQHFLRFLWNVLARLRLDGLNWFTTTFTWLLAFSHSYETVWSCEPGENSGNVSGSFMNSIIKAMAGTLLWTVDTLFVSAWANETCRTRETEPSCNLMKPLPCNLTALIIVKTVDGVLLTFWWPFSWPAQNHSSLPVQQVPRLPLKGPTTAQHLRTHAWRKYSLRVWSGLKVPDLGKILHIDYHWKLELTRAIKL